MSHAVGNKIVEINNEFEKFASDIQFLVDEVKEDVQKTLDEFAALQSSLTERVDKFEDTVQNEVQQLKGLVQDLDQQLEAFKQQASNVVEQSLTPDSLDSDKLNQVLEEHERRLEEIGQLQDQFSHFSNFSPEKLREELISGIRMLGDRVSKAIEDINERIDNFTDEIQGKFNENSYAREERASDQENEDFASLKESKLLDVNDYEIVPREAIKTLTELFKKQSSAVKNFIGNHEQKILEFEQLLKTYDNENTNLLDLLDRRVKRNFLISMVAIIIVILCSVAMRIF